MSGELPMDETGLTVEELAERFGVSVRSIRFYIAQGLLPGPGSRGKAATYGEEHAVRLGLIRQLTERHMPLAKIQALLDGLSLNEVKALRIAEDDLSAQLVEAERLQSPQDYVAALLADARRARAAETPDIAQRMIAKAPSPDTSSVAAPGQSFLASRELTGPEDHARQSPGQSEAWYRWTLAPGVELSMSATARKRFPALLRAVLRAVSGEQGERGES